jgi:glycosyltransferase involved in cell wall biosynthesis
MSSQPWKKFLNASLVKENVIQPMVSIITCTYNRRDFLANLIRMVDYQDYPHDKLEWVIVDDSPKSNLDIFQEYCDVKPTDLPAEWIGQKNGIIVRYIHLHKKISLSMKRDVINYLAQGEYLINMDDDDYYPKCRVSHAVDMLVSSGAPLVGSSKMFMYYTSDGAIYQLGPYRENHGTAATLGYTKQFATDHFYYNAENPNYAEEGNFTEGWKHRLVQLEPMKTVLALSHTNNTIDKTMFREEKHGMIGRSVNPTTLKLEEFINCDDSAEKPVWEFYKGLQYEYKENQYTKAVMDKLEQSAANSQEQYGKIVQQKLGSLLSHAKLHAEMDRIFFSNKPVMSGLANVN